MKFTKIVLASAVLALSSQAFAAIDPVTSDNLNTGGSELVLGVYDNFTETTYLLDTNVAFNDIYNLVDGQSFDFSAELATLSNDFEWQMFAGDDIDNIANANDGSATLDQLGRRAAITTNEPTWDYNVPTGADGLATTQNINAAVALALNGDPIGGWTGTFGYAGLVTQQSAIEGYGVQEFAMLEDIWVNKRVGRNFENAADHVVISHLGSFEFLDDNSLVFSSLGGDPSEVPLPAAAWLLLSGLAGLGGVARRRRS